MQTNQFWKYFYRNKNWKSDRRDFDKQAHAQKWEKPACKKTSSDKRVTVTYWRMMEISFSDEETGTDWSWDGATFII